jgi:hypothetical protein
MSMKRPYIPLERVAECIPQINVPDGIRSCYLTSQLNAGIVAGLITPDQAHHVQETVTEDPKYAGLWVDARQTPVRGFAWNTNPGVTTSVIRTLVGQEVQFSTISPDTIEQTLASGLAVVTVDRVHARTAFGYDDGRSVVYDAARSEDTTVYTNGEVGLYFQRYDHEALVIRNTPRS